jgi:AAA domain, putative AbiEii toxin, Type IV TA system
LYRSGSERRLSLTFTNLELRLMAAAPEKPPPQLDFVGRLGRFVIGRLAPAVEQSSQLGNSSNLDPDVAAAFQTAGSALILAGISVITLTFGYNNSWVFWGSLSVLALGFLAGIGSLNSLRVALRVHSRAAAQADQTRATDPNFRSVETVLAERAASEESLAKRNIKDAFDVRKFEWKNVSIFDDGYYSFAPRVNVLLGRNGFGKTLLFRTLVAVLQHNAQYSAMLFPKDPAAKRPPSLCLTVRRNGKPEQALRDVTYFNSPPDQMLVGKIPVLAIPDSRFVDRTRQTVAGVAASAEGPAANGARNFLSQEPFGNVIEDFLTGLCLDYGAIPTRNPRKRFEHGIFKLVEEVVAELTGNGSFQFAEINRVESRFEILVRTTDSPDIKIPIQAASQGTLSVIAMFGLIHSFLRSLRSDVTEDQIRLSQGIVLIDEIDAHLHPAWQQKILGLLTNRFPNVQFIISAHSPLIVAGCDAGEVSVLRRNEESRRFYVDPIPSDFLGAKTADLYQHVFNIEESDRLYLEYSAKTPKDLETSKNTIAGLEGVEDLSPRQEALLLDSLREKRLIDRADEVRKERMEAVTADARREKVEADLERANYELLEKDREIEQLRAQLAEMKAKDSGQSSDGVHA